MPGDPAALLPFLRWRLAAPLVLAFALPFLLTPIPPLIDLPGHIGRFAVEAAPAGSPIHRYFGFRWEYSLNLGTDLLVAWLRHLFGLFGAAWLVSAAIPAVTVCGVIAVARVLNPRGAHGLPWALIFVFGFPLLWGFVNFALAAGLALLGLALWVRLAERRRLRAAIFLIAAPLLLVAHGVGGALLPLMILGHEAGSRWGQWRSAPRTLAGALWPLLGCAVPILLWKLGAAPASGRTEWLFSRKLDGLLTAVRDQNMVLDIATVALAAGVFVLGLVWRARLRGGSAGPVIALALLYLAVPSVLGGVERIDTRLMPFVAMLALALQDWSGVEPRRRRAVLIAGAALLAVRMAVLAASFHGYARDYARELAALDHVAPGARVLNFTQVECRSIAWRTHRREHLANLATPLRAAWVNAHWAIDGVQSLAIRYRPSPDYFSDPSQLVLPAACIDPSVPADRRRWKTLAEALARAPIDRVDYVWLIGERLPASYAGPALDLRWSNGASALYAVRSPVPIRDATP